MVVWLRPQELRTRRNSPSRIHQHDVVDTSDAPPSQSASSCRIRRACDRRPAGDRPAGAAAISNAAVSGSTGTAAAIPAVSGMGEVAEDAVGTAVRRSLAGHRGAAVARSRRRHGLLSLSPDLGRALADDSDRLRAIWVQRGRYDLLRVWTARGISAGRTPCHDLPRAETLAAARPALSHSQTVDLSNSGYDCSFSRRFSRPSFAMTAPS